MQQKVFYVDNCGVKNPLDINAIISKLHHTGKHYSNAFALSEGQIMGLCYESKKIFTKQPMLLEIKPPINICGDFHGQFIDLKEVFNQIGKPNIGTHYLFLGDYVDRGKQSLECICLLLAYKIKCPEFVFMIRGNHECSELNKVYGFYDECKRRASVRVWKCFCDCFNTMPIAAIIGERIFCVHGGISPLLSNISQINSIKRPTDLVRNSVFCDLLWADPSQIQGWQENQERGVSYTFGTQQLDQFLQKNDLDLVCRSHQVVEEGYEFFNNKKLVTIFSAPNYCLMYENCGAILRVSEDLTSHIKQFKKVANFKAPKERRRCTFLVEGQSGDKSTEDYIRCNEDRLTKDLKPKERYNTPIKATKVVKRRKSIDEASSSK